MPRSQGDGGTQIEQASVDIQVEQPASADTQVAAMPSTVFSRSEYTYDLEGASGSPKASAADLVITQSVFMPKSGAWALHSIASFRRANSSQVAI